MEIDLIYSHSVDAHSVTVKKSEILRYMGHTGDTGKEILDIIDILEPEIINGSTPKCSFVLKSVKKSSQGLSIGDILVNSENLSKNLKNCDYAILFAITIGNFADRMILRQTSISAVRALTADAVSTALVEAYADLFNKELISHMSKESFFLRPRFSPGYGDFDIHHQTDILTVTDATRRCAITLTDGFMLSPSKSVTGVIGVSRDNINCIIEGCEECKKTDCTFRRDGR